MCCERALLPGLVVAVLGACAPAPAPEDEPYAPVALPACTPNLDGRIDAAELPFVVGATARVRVGLDMDVDVDGEPGRGSARIWDLSRPDPGEEPVGLLTLEDMSDQWFADRFPDADVAGPLEPGNALLGPLGLFEDGVKLYGSASAEEDPGSGRTLLSYDEPVTLYPFPLEVGSATETVARVIGGELLGVPVAFEDTTQVSVSAHGQVLLPDLTLDDALRVTIRLSRVPVAGIAVQQVTHVFVNECVGEVARFTSPAVPLGDELPDDFSRAASVWRLSL
ncbi:MAG: hypothetical protein A2138_27805 [Deltaproteobacteria bacterium RBG_16_71_12]|nr:MAG: hypothetical protein A2138_27805 [Deltaproteobacteria bacterium RBG_16_71_12]